MAAMAVVCMPTLVAAEPLPRYAGLQLDPSHRLLTKQVRNLVEIGVVTHGRIPEGKAGHSENPAVAPTMTSEDILVRVKSEVLAPAAPNPFHNPGQRYRITVEGVKVAPGYVSIKDVDAADARAYLFTEFAKLRERTQGINRDALYYAGMIAASALNEAGYLPADIPLSEMRSPTSKVRISNKTLQHKNLQEHEAIRQQQPGAAGIRGDVPSPNPVGGESFPANE